MTKKKPNHAEVAVTWPKATAFSEIVYYAECPKCGRSIQIGVGGDSGFAGSEEHCRNCGTDFIIENEPEDP